MKNYILYYFLLLSFSLYCQDSIRNLKEVIILGTSENSVKEIIKNIKKSCKKNFEFGEKLYHVDQFSILNNNDTILNTSKEVNFFIKSLDNNYTKKNIVNENNLDFKKVDFFNKYKNDKDSPTFWLSEVLYRKNFNVLRFDFFNNLSDYTFEINYNEDRINIHFKSVEMYEGYFVCDSRNFNLIMISFKNSIPYPFYVSENDNGKKISLKKWNYKIESTYIEFENNNTNQFFIKNLTSTEEINNYTFEKYNKKGDTIYSEGPYNFISTLNVNLK